MKEIMIGKNDAGGRLDSFLFKMFRLPSSLMYRCIRTKRIKRNGKRAGIDTRLNEGDILQLYLNDDLLEKKDASEAFARVSGEISVVYEDENILIADKPAGISVHEDESGSDNTLIANIQAYLYNKGEWDPKEENHFAPALANRIDRNTSGLVIAAKNEPALRMLNEKIRLREVEKTYLAACIGRVEPETGTLEGFIFKDEKKKQVYVRKNRTAGAKTARTIYRRVAFENGLSLVECTLDTGRTHQIRAQFADAGFPLLGDRKYGDTEHNQSYSFRYQALCSYRVRFALKTDGGTLAYLNGKTFETRLPGFVAQFFPNYANKSSL